MFWVNTAIFREIQSQKKAIYILIQIHSDVRYVAQASIGYCSQMPEYLLSTRFLTNF